jgi:ADP-ribosylglycohydrolase
MKPEERARLSLEGLAVGDCFGERFFGETEAAISRIEGRVLRPAPWSYTDDTEMALSVTELVCERGDIDCDELARRFARRMTYGRGYGRGAYEVLTGIAEGRPWQTLSRSGFGGMGSFGNGAAMRVAPLGAYFAEHERSVVVDQARRSAEVAHAHPEGIAGAIAVAVAAQLTWQKRHEPTLGVAWLRDVREAVPPGYTRDAIDEALALPSTVGIEDAAKVLGNGSAVTAPDTVPLCLWVVAHHGGSFEEALWTIVRALGDRDTTAAIVGGILALRSGYGGIPSAWRTARERLPVLEDDFLV